MNQHSEFSISMEYKVIHHAAGGCALVKRNKCPTLTGNGALSAGPKAGAASDRSKAPIGDGST